MTAKTSTSSGKLLETDPTISAKGISQIRRYLTKIEINIRCAHSANWRAKDVTVRDLACERFEWQAMRA